MEPILIRPLFKKYQSEILNFANSSFGRDVLNIKTPNPIVKVTPDSYHELLGNSEQLIKLKATFFSKSPYIQTFRGALTALEIAGQSNLAPSQLIKRNSDFLTHPYIYFLDSTFYPDANTETTSVDGWVERSYGGGVAPSWSDIHDGAGTSAGDSDTGGIVASLVTQSDAPAGKRRMRRFYILFDTSSLTSAATITAATFSAYETSHGSDSNSQTLKLTGSNPSSNTAIGTGDYNAYTSTVMSDTATAITSLTDNAYNDWPLNSTGLSNISKTGISKYALRYSADVADSEPGNTNYGSEVYFDQADHATQSHRPKLAVTYSLPTGGSFFISY